MKKFFRNAGLAVLRRVFGVRLVDQRTGEVIGRVIVIRWKGGLRFMGLEDVALRARFLPQEREMYWAQDLGFSTHAPPDFPHVKNSYRVDLTSEPAGGGGDVRDVAKAES